MSEEKKGPGRPKKAPVEVKEAEPVEVEKPEVDPEPVAAEPPKEPRNLTREMVALRLGEDKARQMIQ